MKEVTEVYTIQLTKISPRTDEHADALSEQGTTIALEADMKRVLTKWFDADDVTVKRQVFVRDEE